MKDFIITISRGYGSKGKQIGMALAEELGIPYFDRELFKMASEESGISEQLFAQCDEKINSRFLGILSKRDYEMEVISPDSKKFTSEDNLFNYQAYIIRELAKKGSCIFIGRAADFVLRDRDNVLRINVEAPFDCCVKKVMEMFSLTEQEAARRIVKIDSERNEYYRYHTGRDRRDSLNYDLTINTENLDREAVVELIKRVCEIKFGA